jgi:hypothetical protein
MAAAMPRSTVAAAPSTASRSGLIRASPRSSGCAAYSVASSTSAREGWSFTAAMPRMARTRRSTFVAASRSDGRVASSSAPAPMLETSVTRKPPSGALGWLAVGVAVRAGA